jgi:hypothetical protein
VGNRGRIRHVTSRLELGRPGHGLDLPNPGARWPTRREVEHQAGRVHLDPHDPGVHFHAVPLEDAGQRQRRAAAIRVADVDVADAEVRLRPRAAVRADVRRRAGVHATSLDAVRHHLGVDGLQQ